MTAEKNQDEPRVLRAASCGTLSGRSNLVYQVGCTPDGDVQLRITESSGAGFYSQEWVRFARILELLKPGEAQTFYSLQPLFEGRSVNTGGFLMACLKHLGVVKPMESSPRNYELADLQAVVAEVQALIESDISLGVDARPEGHRRAGKRKGGAASKAARRELDT